MLNMSNKITDIDIRGKQSLELFKSWLAKHRFLKYTGTGKCSLFGSEIQSHPQN